MTKFVRWVLMAFALTAFGWSQTAVAADFPAAKVNFELGKSALPADTADSVKKVAEFLAADATAKVQISGFTDNRIFIDRDFLSQLYLFGIDILK